MFEFNEDSTSRDATRVKVAVALPVAAVMFFLAGIGVGMDMTDSYRPAAAPAATISTGDIQSGIDMKALPVQSVADFT